MSKALAVRYAQIKIEMKKLEVEMKALQPEVLAYIQAAVAEKVPAQCDNLGNFIWYPKKTYTFSEACEAIRTQLEEREADEIGRGTFKEVVETPILKFNQAK